MLLTPEQQAMLDGAEGEVMAKVMRSLVMYGETFGAEKMVPVTSKYGHTVISFGIGVMKPVYELYDKLLEAGAVSKQRFPPTPCRSTARSPRTSFRTSSSSASCTRSKGAMRPSSRSSGC